MKLETSSRLQTGEISETDPKAKTQTDLFAGGMTGLEAEQAGQQAIIAARERQKALQDELINRVRAVAQAVDAAGQQQELTNPAEVLTPEQQRIADIRAKKAANSALSTSLSGFTLMSYRWEWRNYLC